MIKRFSTRRYSAASELVKRLGKETRTSNLSGQAGKFILLKRLIISHFATSFEVIKRFSRMDISADESPGIFPALRCMGW
ncbi:hypothetical protein ARTHRO9AX_20067 [Arthrobacter sp. 9AX]|nr:hypothetical protein ARTHRO9AX_20067 [Arthrobacter sp. 9AX]